MWNSVHPASLAGWCRICLGWLWHVWASLLHLAWGQQEAGPWVWNMICFKILSKPKWVFDLKEQNPLDSWQWQFHLEGQQSPGQPVDGWHLSQCFASWLTEVQWAITYWEIIISWSILQLLLLESGTLTLLLVLILICLCLYPSCPRECW